MTDVPAPVRILIVDDHALVREGLRARLEALPRLRVVGEAESGERGLELAQALRPDLMLVDVGMRDMTGIRLATLLADRVPEVAVLMLSMYDHEEYVVSAVRAGARGYVLKDASVHELITAIDAVVAGGVYYSSGVAKALLQVRSAPDDLTPREREILLLLAHGQSNKTVARALDISTRTVETHRLRLRRKLGIDSPSGLLKYAVERGWTTLR
ncbi:MAG: response regulator transcription factor [Burkholderiales bacterium]|nr:response regulator transcription factor [Burkholderiales bacterium]